MFSSANIFSEFRELITYIGSRDILMRPKQFHDESFLFRENVWKLENIFWVKKAFFLAQCQSSVIVSITENNLDDLIYADACFSQLQGISLNIVVADCVPILLYDSKKQIIWAVHAGWRGSSEKILQKTLRAMQDLHRSDMKDIFLCIWPCISQKNYEVGEELVKYFPEDVIFVSEEKYYLDLRAENLRQAQELWILTQHIEVSDECTFELSEKYFSYRREKCKANFVCGIGMEI